MIYRRFHVETKNQRKCESGTTCIPTKGDQCPRRHNFSNVPVISMFSSPSASPRVDKSPSVKTPFSGRSAIPTITQVRGERSRWLREREAGAYRVIVSLPQGSPFALLSEECGRQRQHRRQRSGDERKAGGRRSRRRYRWKRRQGRRRW